MLQNGSSVCTCCQVSYEAVSDLTGFPGSPSELEMNTGSQHLPFPVSQLLDIREKGEQKVWWNLVMGSVPKKPTWASLPLREIISSCLESLSSLEKCHRDFVDQRWLRLDCYIKCLRSSFICCRLSHQASLISRCFSTLQTALTVFALCSKNSSMMIFTLLFAFALLFAADPLCSTTEDAWWTIKLCHLSLQALPGRHESTPPREHFIISQILLEQIPNIWGTTWN